MHCQCPVDRTLTYEQVMNSQIREIRECGLCKAKRIITMPSLTMMQPEQYSHYQENTHYDPQYNDYQH